MTKHLKAKPAGTPTWIDVIWPDAAAARTFYQAVFGWEFDVGGPEFGNYSTARLGKHTVAGIVGSEPNLPAVKTAGWKIMKSAARTFSVRQPVTSGHRLRGARRRWHSASLEKCTPRLLR